MKQPAILLLLSSVLVLLLGITSFYNNLPLILNWGYDYWNHLETGFIIILHGRVILYIAYAFSARFKGVQRSLLLPVCLAEMLLILFYWTGKGDGKDLFNPVSIESLIGIWLIFPILLLLDPSGNKQNARGFFDRLIYFLSLLLLVFNLFVLLNPYPAGPAYITAFTPEHQASRVLNYTLMTTGILSVLSFVNASRSRLSKC